ncbi:hypothetical protein SEVIR_9G569950v4 [Setaria viridis]
MAPVAGGGTTSSAAMATVAGGGTTSSAAMAMALAAARLGCHGAGRWRSRRLPWRRPEKFTGSADGAGDDRRRTFRPDSRAGAKSKRSIPRFPLQSYHKLDRVFTGPFDHVEGSGGRDSPDPIYPSPIHRHQLEPQMLPHSGHHSPVRRNGRIWRRIVTGAAAEGMCGDRKTLAWLHIIFYVVGGQLTYLLDIVINS